MDCSRFQDRLERFQEGSLAPEERPAFEAHSAACASCRELMRFALRNLDITPLDPRRDLTDSILEKTSGPACGRAREHLCDFLDGGREGSYADILSLHLENCGDCAALAASLTELKDTLPQMGEIEPGSEFTFRVLRATSRKLPESQFSPRTRVYQWWLRLIQRPRFSWEAAYLGTILLVSVLGNPLTSFHDLSVRTAEVFRSQKPFSWVSLALPGSLVRSETGVMRRAREFAGAFAAAPEAFSKSAAGHLARRAHSLQAAAETDFQVMQSLPQKALSIWKAAWTKILSVTRRWS